MTSHLSPDTVADLQEGLLDAREAMSAQAHLLDCRRCAALRDDLAAVSGDLAAAGEEPVPMPAELVARIDEAVTAASPTRPVTAAADVTPLHAAELGPRTPAGMRLLQAAAVVVLLLAGVGVAVTALQGDGANDRAATSGTADGGAEAPAEAQDAGAYPVTASGQNWSEETVVDAIPRLVAGDFPREPAAERQATQGGGDVSLYADDDARRLSGGRALADCVTALNDGPVTPLAVDLATWQGSAAAVVVLPTAGDPTTVDLWVVGPSCGPDDAAVRYFARAARP